MAGSLFNGADGTLPAESIFRRDLPLDETAAGETHKARVHLVEHLCQVRAQTVLAVLECWREETYYVYLQRTLTVEDQGELCLRVIADGGQFSGEFRPIFTDGTVNFRFCVDVASFLIAEGGLDGAFVVAFGPERQAVLSALHGVDAPETLVH